MITIFSENKGQGTNIQYAIVVLLVVVIIMSGLSVAYISGMSEKISDMSKNLEKPTAWGEKGPILLGAGMPLSGKYESSGTAMYEAYKLAIQYVNEELGGIKGRKLKLKVYDDKSDPAQSRKLYRKLIYNDKVDMLLSPSTSGITKAVVPVAEKAEMPLVTSFASDVSVWAGQNREWSVQAAPPTKGRWRAPMEYMAEKVDSIGIAYEKTAYPRGIAKDAKDYAEKYGMDVVAFEGFAKEVRSYEPVVRKIKDAGAEFFLVAGYVPDSIGCTNAANSIDYKPKYFAVNYGMRPDYANSVKDRKNTILAPCFWSEKAETEGILWSNQEWVERYQEEYGETPSEVHCYGLIGFTIVYEALKESAREKGKIDYEWINEYIHNHAFQTIFPKPKDFTATGEDRGLLKESLQILMQWQDGKGELVFPEDIATSEMKTYSQP